MPASIVKLAFAYVCTSHPLPRLTAQPTPRGALIGQGDARRQAKDYSASLAKRPRRRCSLLPLLMAAPMKKCLYGLVSLE